LDVVTKWRKDGIDDQRQNKEESWDKMKVRINTPQDESQQVHFPRQTYHGNILKESQKKNLYLCDLI
jgi:hypothetical protein